MKWLIVGQAPGRIAKDGPLLSGQSATRLRSLLMTSRIEFEARATTMNVDDEYRGKAGKGDLFKLRRGHAKFKVLTASHPSQPILLCGLAVARACGLIDAPILRWFAWEGRWVAIMPHPSGINQWWNSAHNRVRAKSFLSHSWRVKHGIGHLTEPGHRCFVPRARGD